MIMSDKTGIQVPNTDWLRKGWKRISWQNHIHALGVWRYSNIFVSDLLQVWSLPIIHHISHRTENFRPNVVLRAQSPAVGVAKKREALKTRSDSTASRYFSFI